MKLYRNLAVNGIKKNSKLYFPYILTCVGMVAMYYIIVFLQTSKAVTMLKGEAMIKTTLYLGTWVIAVFSMIFLFYTNSFLVRKRKKEFGLYNILGMNKKNISKVLAWESLIIASISLVGGLAVGTAVSKLAELGLVNMLKGDVSYDLSVSLPGVILTLGVFCVIFLLLFVNTLRQIGSVSAISLLHSENTGEKAPKANWAAGVLGVILLAAAYFIAVTVKNPLSAMNIFFTAVILVIIATYLLLISGSVLLCRILQRKKSYYYKPNHFVSVSSMSFRMKRNGAGLASICILATMVLVMISSTASLYIGTEDSLVKRYPHEMNVTLTRFCDTIGDTFDAEALKKDLAAECEKAGGSVKNAAEYKYIMSYADLGENKVNFNIQDPAASAGLMTAGNAYQILIVGLDDYNRLMNKHETLGKNEIMIYSAKNRLNCESLTLGSKEMKVTKRLDSFVDNGNDAMNIVPTMYIIVENLEETFEDIKPADDSGISMHCVWDYSFDTGLDADGQVELAEPLRKAVGRAQENAGKDLGERENGYSYSLESRQANRDDFYSLYGGLFFLGILLSIVFLFAAVLIIYYKQISEGYEDQARFDIMQQVGMTKKEIRKSINSQLLTVFFLPLLGAGLHMAFAFPIINRILLVFNLNNVSLFAVTTGVCFAVFALFYTAVYKLTSNAYYSIVSSAKEERRE